MAPRTYNPCSYLPRRLQVVGTVAILLILTIVFFGISTEHEIPYRDEAVKDLQKAADYLPRNIPKFSSSSWLHPFRPPTHEPPPEQSNSTSGDAKWFSDWTWQNPFSSSVTLDENRVVLPAERLRTPVYTYYDSDVTKEEKIKKAEHELLITWRRAWWAKGFRPVVLGPPEAVRNPLYRKMQNLGLEDRLSKELMRWLAWGNMGSGILANWLTYPMTDYDDSMLIYLRHGEFPHLTRYEGLENGLFVGDKTSINKAVDLALSAKQPIKANSIVDIVPKDTFSVDPKHEAIAFYSTEFILKNYKELAEKLQAKDLDTRVAGLMELPKLVTSHLHNTWQSVFYSGITVLKPLPAHMTSVVFTASELARNLTQCPDSPYPSTCPPNDSRCKPCVASHPKSISYAAEFRNVSTQFTIGTVPHPHTLAFLAHQDQALTTKFIRRNTKRDEWIQAATKEFLGTGVSSFARLGRLKDAVASDYGSSHTLWLTAEREDDANWHEDLAWIFGFSIPNAPSSTGRSETPVPGPERRPPPPKPEGKIPEEAELKKERRIIAASKEVLRGKAAKAKVNGRTREVLEAWNLADAEFWRFVRAFAARRRVERKKWEEEERAFAGSDSKGTWGRWFDRDAKEDDSRM